MAIAANFGRKFFVQGKSAIAGDWDETLAAEHDWALAIFDKMLATDPSQSFKRTMLLKKLGHALDKHTHEEEKVVYPALRQADDKYDADLLEGEHGYVKTYLYELDQMGADAPNWLEKVREFRHGREACADGGRRGLPAFQERPDRRAKREDHETRQQGRVYDGLACLPSLSREGKATPPKPASGIPEPRGRRCFRR